MTQLVASYFQALPHRSHSWTRSPPPTLRSIRHLDIYFGDGIVVWSGDRTSSPVRGYLSVFG